MVVPDEKYIDESEAVQLNLANFNPASQYVIPKTDTILKPEMVSNIAMLKDFTTYKPTFIKLINAINSKGYKVTITDGLRPYWRQIRDYKDNPEQYGNKEPTMNAPHIVGRALDIVIYSVSSATTFSKNFVDGNGTKRIIELEKIKAQWNTTGIPQLAKSMGFNWGGDYNKPDCVHFQIGSGADSPTKTIMHTVMEDTKEKYTEWSLDYSVVFKNVKTNPFTFNFFLKNLQFDKKFKQVNSRQVYNSDAEGSLSSNVTVTANKR